ncbi:MAG: hypothetical protein AB1510_09695 [Bacillota bacterium]
MATDMCDKIRRQIESHRRAIEQLRRDRDSYEGIAHQSQVGSDPEGIEERIHRHEESILNLQALLEHNGC